MSLHKMSDEARRPGTPVPRTDPGHNHKLEIFYAPTERVQVQPDHPKVYSKADLKKAKRIVGTYGMRLPILVDPSTASSSAIIC